MPQEYNFYDWKTYEDKENQNLMNVYRNAGRLGNQLADFQSPFYQQYASYLSKVIPTTGINSYLQLLQSGGGNYAGSMSQATQLKENEDKKRREAINTGVQGFASSNVSMLGQLLEIQGQAGANILNARTQKEISGDQQGGILDFLGSGFGAALPFLPQMFGGGGASAMLAAPAFTSDIRLKENIDYTGEKTKDGIPIVEFNFKGIGQRCRGVIAQDVEKIRPDLVEEINGYLTVNYGGL
jgi:hypothetical protein